ncbi:MAG: TetR/AcrR family transcriptional regulator [Chitinophagaceae bacterium]
MDTRKKILHKALQLINQKGFSEVGVREIARSLQLSPGNMSYHFPRKEDIFTALMDNYMQANSENYAGFGEGAPTLKRYLEIVQKALQLQYKYRGLFLTFPYFFGEIHTGRSKYPATYKKRKNDILQILTSLHHARQLQLKKSDIDFLFSFLSLFGRFSIIEAFMLHRNRKEADILKHYLTMLMNQLLLFATASGKRSINEFRKAYF